MTRKKVKEVEFSDRIEKYAKEFIEDTHRVRIAINQYLMLREKDFLQASKEGYTYSQIAKVATLELLESDIPKTFESKDNEGNEIIVETQLRPKDIKNICESKGI